MRANWPALSGIFPSSAALPGDNGTDFALNHHEECRMVDDDEITEDGEQAKNDGGMMKIILIVNAVLVLIAIAVGVTFFVMSGSDDDKPVDTEMLESAESAPQAPVRRSGPPVYIPLNPAFVVNFENQEQVSFLQVDIQLMTYDPAVVEAINVHMPRVRNELLLLLGGKQYHEINTREGKRVLAQEAITEIKRVLEEAGAPASIEALYFTSFVMQ
jgi:flagellar FliL protein